MLSYDERGEMRCTERRGEEEERGQLWCDPGIQKYIPKFDDDDDS
jgi:hypothetical protein